MMGQKDRRFDPLSRNASLEDLVPRDNFYRRLEKRLDLLRQEAGCTTLCRWW